MFVEKFIYIWKVFMRNNQVQSFHICYLSVQKIIIRLQK